MLRNGNVFSGLECSGPREADLCCVLAPSDQRKQPLSHGAQRRSVPAQRLQQWPQLLVLLLAGQPAAAAGLRRPTAQQAEAFPHDPAAVRKRHLARNWRARPHAGARTGGECGLADAAPLQLAPVFKTCGTHYEARIQACSIFYSKPLSSQFDSYSVYEWLPCTR